MPKPRILLRFDTEDYITPESNTALYDVLEVLEELDIKATFILTGHKIEMLVNDGETAILDYLQHHALGYHSYLHSFHPLAMEYLEGRGWWEGIEEFLKVEDPGHETFVEIFDQPPVCYTQPGADWVPHTFVALQQWEVPFFFTDSKYSLINLHDEPFLVNGILTLAKTPTATDMTNLATNPDSLFTLREKFVQDYRAALEAEELGLIVLICHPDRFVAQGQAPWDVLNFANGENVPRAEWKKPPLKSQGDYALDLSEFKEFLRHLKQDYDLSWITAQDFVDMYQNRIIHKDRVVDTLTQHTSTANPSKMMDLKAIQQIATTFTQEISYLRVGELWLSPVQAASILCQTLLTREKEGYFPHAVPVPNEIFFPEDIPHVAVEQNLDRLGWTDLVDGCREIITRIKKDASFPARIKVGGGIWVEFNTFMGGVAQAILTMSIDGLEQDRVLLPKNRLQTADYVKKGDEVAWAWPVFKSGYRNNDILRLTELVTWTMKPLLLSEVPAVQPFPVNEQPRVENDSVEEVMLK